MNQQFHQFALRLLHQLRGGHPLQLQAQRQRVDEHPQDLLCTRAPLQPTQQHGAKHYLLTSTGVAHHQTPSRVKQSRGTHA